ncbi:hypothetical protein Ae201684P_021934 [Aphanomyces euteiches]|nr:hypothetical protein Ae201684P_021934 [Aphanomyces euteiches]
METTESPSAIEETNRRGNGMTTESVAANTTDPKLANEDAEEPTTDSVQVDGFELFQTRAAKTVSWNCELWSNRHVQVQRPFRDGQVCVAYDRWPTIQRVVAQAFARLIGSTPNTANNNSATAAFQVAINAPGRVSAPCSGPC